MENSVEKLGKTVEEAVKEALKVLNAKKDDVDVEILEEEKKGFLGIGSKDAKVKVTLKERIAEQDLNGNTKVKADVLSKIVENINEEASVKRIGEFLSKIIDSLEADANFEISNEPKVIRVTLKGEGAGKLVGTGGKVLEAIQQVLNVVLYNKEGMTKRILVDTEQYRKKREVYLKGLANRTAEKVLKYKKSITLSPMNSFERMIVHSELQQFEEIKTFSVDEEPNRKIVVSLK